MAEKIEQEIFEEQRDEIKTLVEIIVRKIHAGDAPDEAIALYQNMTPESFTYWLHGFVCSYTKRKFLCNSALFRFLKEEIRGQTDDNNTNGL